MGGLVWGEQEEGQNRAGCRDVIDLAVRGLGETLQVYKSDAN